jgi:hygromycin-B 4-O-kinase
MREAAVAVVHVYIRPMAKPSLSNSTIRAALQERWGEISAFERLAEGLDSQTYGLRHDGAEYVARVNRSSCGFQEDAFVYRRFASPALPIPEIVEIARLDDGHVVCVSRRAAGGRVHDLTAVELRRIIDSITALELYNLYEAARRRADHRRLRLPAGRTPGR